MESRLLYLRHVDNARKEEGTERSGGGREGARRNKAASAAQHGIESEREKALCDVAVAVAVKV